MASAWNIELEENSNDEVAVHLSGIWKKDESLPAPEQVFEELRAHRPKTLSFRAEKISQWDSGLISFIVGLYRRAADEEMSFDPSGLPEGAQRLLRLATAVPPRKSDPPSKTRFSLISTLGKAALAAAEEFRQLVVFLGSCTLAFGSLLSGRAQYRRIDFTRTIQESGPEAFPIVSLISLLVGLILAYIGVEQLEQLGAGIYVADLVGIAMCREMGAIMAGIIMAGRTGAAFAAQIGTMQVNQEIDALRTLGISPIQFLVLPRMLALILMMPLLCVYADLMGMIGGAIVALSSLDVSLTAYFLQTEKAMTTSHFLVGVGKSVVFGIIVAGFGCMRGIQCGSNAAAVGKATTSAVVSAIVAIIVADALFAVLFGFLGI